ncbi:STAS domain-containing protein [Streptacidiphilus rugosus]|uniref:STAS domain-containing protein n=1 Tax=Streptacidiphilus rugosus TaxID=405783 RepID=UPI00056A284E|nr:STAS domain-containing protein [Streptacidiphilus rugosus]
MTAALFEESTTGLLKVDIHRVGAVVVCRMTGDLYLDTLSQAEHALEAAAADLPPLLCVDMHQAQMCDATGLGLLLRLSVRVPLAVVDPSHQVTRVLQLSEVSLALRVFPTVDDAIEALHRMDQGNGPASSNASIHSAALDAGARSSAPSARRRRH